MPEDAAIHGEAVVRYSTESYLDLPFVVIGLIIALWFARRRGSGGWLLVATLVLFAIHHGIVYVMMVADARQYPHWMTARRILGTAGWLLLAIYAFMCDCRPKSKGPTQEARGGSGTKEPPG